MYYIFLLQHIVW